jgi:hypothetical protein
VSLSLTVTGTGFASADSLFVVDVGDNLGSIVSTTDNATVVVDVDESDATTTFTSSTSVKITGLALDFTAASDSSADVDAAAKAFAIVVNVDVGNDDQNASSRTVSVSDSGYFDTPIGYSYTANSAVTQIVGGQATLQYFPDADFDEYTITISGVGSIVSATANGGNVADKANGDTWSDGISWNTITAVDEIDIRLTSGTVGTTTVSFLPVNSLTGVPGTAVTATVTWVVSGTANISDTGTTVAIVSSLAACDFVTDKATQDSNVSAYARSSMSYRDTDQATGRQAYLCVIARDGQGNQLDEGSIDTVVISTTHGSFSSGGVITRVASDLTDTGSSEGYVEIYGDNLAAGAGTISVTLIDGASTVTRSLPFTFYGKVSQVSLTTVTSAITADSATVFGNDYIDGTSAATKGDTTVAFSITCKDSGDRTVASCDINGDGVANDSVYTIVDTDLVAGSPTYNSAAPANVSDSYVSVTGTVGGSLSAVNYLSSYVLVDANDALTEAQALSIKVCAEDENTAGTNATLCASGTYYLSGAASTIVVTPSATTLAAGGTATVNVTVKDANGYPVGDGTAVTLAATNGSVVAPSAKTTSNGTFAAPANFVAGSEGASSIVTAIVGSKSGSATIAITGGSSDSANAAADAAAEAIDAANAATDAANLAAEAADAATVAAEEARDAADAATAAVEELATQVATLMAALKAQITTLANTVAKIAKKVKA